MKVKLKEYIEELRGDLKVACTEYDYAKAKMLRLQLVISKLEEILNEETENGK